ncbi:MAG: glycosyltransferase family 1 protein [Bacillota bacterium]|nr:glycosyltransferase family 1 protein [Bacillota bacterium]
MKIGIDGRAAKWYRGTGIGTYTYQLVKCLNKLDLFNKYMLFIPQSCNFDINFNRNFKLKNITENIKTNFWDEVNIPNILMDKDIELYHVPQNGVGLPIDKRCKFVITLHDVIPYKMPETVSDRYLKIFLEELPSLINLCDGIITVSKYSKEDISKTFNYPKDKIYVTHLAAEDIYTPMDKYISKTLINQHYSIQGDFILYVGGFSPRKNIIGTIEAFANLLQRLKKDIKLVVAGRKGKSYDIYIKKAQELGVENNVIFPGFIAMEHMPYLYSAAELLVYPSFYEGFGLPPIEAMACGVPVIASNTTSVPEVVDNSAILIDPQNADDICEAMYRVLSDERLYKELKVKGFSRASSLSWEKTSIETLEVYKKIMLT